jgi:hypothetical protein
MEISFGSLKKKNERFYVKFMEVEISLATAGGDNDCALQLSSPRAVSTLRNFFFENVTRSLEQQA